MSIHFCSHLCRPTFFSMAGPTNVKTVGALSTSSGQEMHADVVISDSVLCHVEARSVNIYPYICVFVFLFVEYLWMSCPGCVRHFYSSQYN